MSENASKPRADSALTPEVADLLIYLGEMGFRDLYLGAGEPSPEARAERPNRPPAAGPPQRRPEPAPPQGRRPPPASPRRKPSGPAAPVAAAPPYVLDEVPADAAGRRTKLDSVASEAASCVRCKLCDGRQSVVFGNGNPDADLMLVGEGPGALEDRQGLPFVGPAGQLLNRILEAIGQRREDVYIANVVKCRPPRNRDPQPEEVVACRGFLAAQIALVQPKLIVILGRVAAQTLLDTDSPLGRLRGRWLEVEGVMARATYHPAALLRNEVLKRPTWEDMQLVRDRLAQL